MDVTGQGEAFQRDLRDAQQALINARERIRELVAERDQAIADRDRVTIERDALQGVLTGQQQRPAQIFPTVGPGNSWACTQCGATVPPGAMHACGMTPVTP